jgi:Zn-dependent protease with chaperone function
MMKSYREWANENISVFTGIKPKYIRKVEPAPAPHPTIEERLERIEAAIAKLQKP